MLRISHRYWFIFGIIAVATVAAIAPVLAADSLYAAGEGSGEIAKVKPSSPDIWKVRPFSGWSSGFKALSGLNPVTWGPSCYLPTPAKGQFLVGPKLFFANLSGEARRQADIIATEETVVDFDRHLGLRKSGNMIWSLEALYQFRPRWAITYSFSPLSVEATSIPLTSFSFAGRSFLGGSEISSKWERWEHRAGLMFNLSRTTNSQTSLFAEWLYLQDKLSIYDHTGSPGARAVVWDDTKNLAVVGLRLDKCLKNYRGNTLAFNAKGGLAFFDDSMGYEAEAGLNYMIPIKRGRFGFIRGGYRYSYLKKETDRDMFGTTLHGAFLQLGFLF